MIAIIDYGAGNIHSIEKALEYVGAKVQVTDDPGIVNKAQAVVLPGVGSGRAAMARIVECGLDDAIRNAIRQGKPFLGICLGGQLLADACGGKVRKHTLAEFGFCEVQLTEQGKADQLFAGFRTDYQTVFHWHEDTFDLPVGATLLATSEATPNQAFRYGERAYGLQYHIEIDDTTLNTWLYDPECKQSVLETHGMQIYTATEQARIDLLPVYHQHSRMMVENFLRISEVEVGE